MLYTCVVCGKERDVPQRKVAKYCSREHQYLDHRGRKFPHDPVWEANRLAAMVVAGRKRKGVKTGPKPPGVIEKMHAGLAVWRAANPDLARAQSVGNLPKDATMDKNGNWRGGTTKAKRDFATQNSTKMKKWRESVFERDGHQCKNCGSTEKLECHHILPLMVSTAFAFHRANGVCLCHKCHKKTDSWAHKGRDNKPAPSGNIHILFIPQSWQDYDTCGNWQVGEDGSILVLISKMPDRRHQQLVAIHELVECLTCLVDGVTQEDVDAFDMGPGADLDEPGNDPTAPYFAQHAVATEIEKILAKALHVEWAEYDAAVGDHGVKEVE